MNDIILYLSLGWFVLISLTSVVVTVLDKLKAKFPSGESGKALC